MKWQILLTSGVLTLAVLACGGGSKPQTVVSNTPGTSPNLITALPAGDPAHGEQLFKGQVDGQYPCSVCHTLTPGKILVGPSLAGIATTAATRISGHTAEQYLRESILTPKAFTVPGFQSGIMPSDFAREMNDQQLADLIAFLLTQK